ncbi:nucleotidyltransferase domain-containing protein [Mesomycoplasma neurolyticum]|uniref:Polymerase nucleotidyl transferase domain-containing protein n=1 Tax=Mesomycoplasma neurolyticum TaxID=2120 RepID=A0A449A5X7_9BACT|nr:nucleotidyltransferase domain-containing protein [Mesomycoplasma neurolyticum]VEU59634.1 Uncharacterised protein [Mesomycoplasma neurolyticum]
MLISFNGLDKVGKTTIAKLFYLRNSENCIFLNIISPLQKGEWFKIKNEELIDIFLDEYKKIYTLSKQTEKIIVLDKGLKELERRLLATAIFSGISKKKFYLTWNQKIKNKKIEEENATFLIKRKKRIIDYKNKKYFRYQKILQNIHFTYKANIVLNMDKISLFNSLKKIETFLNLNKNYLEKLRKIKNIELNKEMTIKKFNKIFYCYFLKLKSKYKFDYFLTGSYSNSQNSENSDLDILILIDDKYYNSFMLNEKIGTWNNVGINVISKKYKNFEYIKNRSYLYLEKKLFINEKRDKIERVFNSIYLIHLLKSKILKKEIIPIKIIIILIKNFFYLFGVVPKNKNETLLFFDFFIDRNKNQKNNYDLVLTIEKEFIKWWKILFGKKVNFHF